MDRSTLSASRLSSASFISLKIFIYWLYFTVCGILVPWPGIEPGSTAVKALSFNHWTTSRFPLPPLLVPALLNFSSPWYPLPPATGPLHMLCLLPIPSSPLYLVNSYLLFRTQSKCYHLLGHTLTRHSISPLTFSSEKKYSCSFTFIWLVD